MSHRLDAKDAVKVALALTEQRILWVKDAPPSIYSDTLAGMLRAFEQDRVRWQAALRWLDEVREPTSPALEDT